MSKLFRWTCSTPRYPVDYVDVITEPGMDGLVADSNNSIETIIQKVQISIEKNYASTLFVVGHHDCKGNPVDETTHREQILQSVKRLQEKFPNIETTGLWVNKEWKVEKL